MRTRYVLGLSLLAIAGCGDPTSRPGSGRTQILLTDGPFPYDRIARVDMHIVKVQVAATPDTIGSQSWTTVVQPNRTINLLELQAGKTTLLGETEVDAGTVGAVRVVLNTSLSSVTDIAGRKVTVHWPVDGEIAIHAYVESSLASFVEGTPHNLVIDFDVGRSFEDILGDGTLWFIPWIRALDDAGAGAIAGTIRGPSNQPMANVAVTVLAGDPHASPLTWWKVATGKTDAQGKYKVAFLLLGKYIVRAEPLTSGAGCRDSVNVQVTNGQTTTLDMALGTTDVCARHTSGGGGPDSTGGGTPPGGGPDTSGTGGPDTTAVGGPVAGVTVTVWPQNPIVNDSIGAYANLTNAQGASLYNRVVAWSVSDTTVLRVTGTYGQSLVLRAKKSGSATITATSEGITGTKTLTVP